MISLTLGYPPSSNRYWRNMQGRMVKSQEARVYCNEVGWTCARQGIEPLTGDVCVSLWFYRPAKRGDLDNHIKILLDALNGHAYVDDKQVAELHAVRQEGKSSPRVVVVVKRAGE